VDTPAAQICFVRRVQVIPEGCALGAVELDAVPSGPLDLQVLVTIGESAPTYDPVDLVPPVLDVGVLDRVQEFTRSRPRVAESGVLCRGVQLEGDLPAVQERQYPGMQAAELGAIDCPRRELREARRVILRQGLDEAGQQ